MIPSQTKRKPRRKESRFSAALQTFVACVHRFTVKRSNANLPDPHVSNNYIMRGRGLSTGKTINNFLLE
jgi:hypothetical protein